jgi:hypothetical protein
MEAWQAVVLAVVALLVGALLPVLFQLLLTLRAVRSAVERAGPALASITATAERLERLTARIEEGGRVETVLGALDSLSHTVGKLQETARLASTIGAAVVPAVAAAVQAWRASRGDEDVAPQATATEATPSGPAGGTP